MSDSFCLINSEYMLLSSVFKNIYVGDIVLNNKRSSHCWKQKSHSPHSLYDSKNKKITQMFYHNSTARKIAKSSVK